MKILLFGCLGQVGWELRHSLAALGDLHALDKGELDLCDLFSLSKLIRAESPDLIVNASAYTAVDRAEQESKLAHLINASAPEVMADEAARVRAAFIHISTDYVFDGTQKVPYVESDLPNPINEYGRSKLAGETAIRQVGGNYLILRTSWVYSLRGESFVRKVLDWARENPALMIVSDQVSNPTWARLLAETIALLVARGGTNPVEYIHKNCGLYHLACLGYASRFQWAQAILDLDPRKSEQIFKTIEPVNSDRFPSPARRPAFSALDCSRFEKIFGIKLPTWQESLSSAFTRDTK